MYAGAAHLNHTLYGTPSPPQAFLTSSFLSTISLPPFIEIINVYKYTQLYMGVSWYLQFDIKTVDKKGISSR